MAAPDTPATGKSVVVIGGGVAGIAASVALAAAGFRVELVEKRPLLGGRASSHVDPNSGEQIDECQHGTMRCCTCLADLLERLGVNGKIRYHDTLHFLDSDGKRSSIYGSGLPAPLHTSLSFLRFRSLGLKDKIGIARAMLRMLRSSASAELETTDVGSWFIAQRQTPRAIKRFWAPILVSACNETIDRISCSHAFKIITDGFLKNSKAFHFGIPTVPLGTLYTDPTVNLLSRHGGSVRLKTIVADIKLTNRAAGEYKISQVNLNNGESLTADYYILAFQQDLLMKLLPEEVTSGIPYWQQLKQIECSPIIGVHLWFDRRVECPEALAILDRETEWVFNKTRNFDLPDVGPTYLSAVISASRRFSKTSKEELVAMVLTDLRACLPDLGDAELLRSQVVKWPKATFSPLPGVEPLRPDQKTSIPNLFLAGEWTDTGWPSTMESAARSGYLAAEYILQREGGSDRLVPPDLPRSWLAKIFGSP